MTVDPHNYGLLCDRAETLLRAADACYETAQYRLAVEVLGVASKVVMEMCAHAAASSAIAAGRKTLAKAKEAAK